MRLRLPWHGRRLALMGAVAAVAMLAGALTGVQIRAAQADERRAADAAQEAADRAAEAAAAADARLRADHALRVAVHLDWSSGARAAAAALADADAALAASEGKVTDDAVRQTLATLAEALRATLAAPPQPPTSEAVAALVDGATQLVAATMAVTEAQATWQAEQDAAAGAAAAAAAATTGTGFVARGWPYDGAAPDCGGPQSYQPSEGAGFHTSVPTEDGDGSNGNLPRSAMTALGWCTDSLGNQQWLRTDAAEAMTRMNDAFRAEFGENIAIDLSYRSYADQVAIRAALGSLAARPGTSNHGLGLAIDTWEWAAYDFGTPRYEWLVTNGPTYGWISPSAQDSSNPEYWHFEYTG